ncbi:hypothetical protein L1887_11644 [Cichorium endivia]|nr:hypothetical protein L1887_11644 [Cichorium endivia]
MTMRCEAKIDQKTSVGLIELVISGKTNTGHDDDGGRWRSEGGLTMRGRTVTISMVDRNHDLVCGANNNYHGRYDGDGDDKGTSEDPIGIR